MHATDNDDEFTPSQIIPGETFWVLQIIGTDRTVMMLAEKDRDPTGPITFATEKDAEIFASRYNVPAEFSPVKVTTKGKVH